MEIVYRWDCILVVMDLYLLIAWLVNDVLISFLRFSLHLIALPRFMSRSTPADLWLGHNSVCAFHQFSFFCLPIL